MFYKSTSLFILYSPILSNLFYNIKLSFQNFILQIYIYIYISLLLYTKGSLLLKTVFHLIFFLLIYTFIPHQCLQNLLIPSDISITLLT